MSVPLIEFKKVSKRFGEKTILDQVDLVVGIWIFLYFLLKPSLCFMLWSLALTVMLHVAVSSVGYLLKMRKTVV